MIQHRGITGSITTAKRRPLITQKYRFLFPGQHLTLHFSTQQRKEKKRAGGGALVLKSQGQSNAAKNYARETGTHGLLVAIDFFVSN
jgi:hypothetical protein